MSGNQTINDAIAAVGRNPVKQESIVATYHTALYETDNGNRFFNVEVQVIDGKETAWRIYGLKDNAMGYRSAESLLAAIKRYAHRIP